LGRTRSSARGRERWNRIGSLRPLLLPVFFVLSLGAGLGSSTLSCVSTRLQPEQLPEQPIAFLHWPDKAATKRAEIFEKAAELPPPPPGQEQTPERTLREIQAHLRAEVSPALQLRLAKHPGRLMLYWPQTGEIEPVEAAPLDALPLAWSPDHQRLLFASARRGGEVQLYEYHMERRDLSPITTGPAEHPRGSYVGDGRLVIHRSEQRSRYSIPHQSLVLTGLAGRIERVIAEDVIPGSMHFLAGQDRIVYEKVDVRPRSDGPAFYQSMVATMGLEPGATEQTLVRGREPTPTPDGQWIVFASESSAGYRLRRMRVDGTSRVPIRPGDTEERMPSVSPDGEFIVFVHVVNGRRRLAVRRFDGTQERMLLKEGWSEFPVW
jgi:hypothetical protein